MAATETRLLVLASVSIFGPVNGYQLGQELTTWRVQEWAHLKPGSIYQSLSTLAARGLVERHDLPEGNRTIAVYEITDAGRAEMLRLFEQAMVVVDFANPLPFHTAIALNSLVDRETYLDLLRRRLEAIDAIEREWEDYPMAEVPPAVRAGTDLWQTLNRVELDWVRDQIDRIAAGEQVFRGEPPWEPPVDELSITMRADRERYRSELGRD